MDKYGYIGIETLLNFCENSKDHAVTPNDFMRMNRARVPERKTGKWVKGTSGIKVTTYRCSKCGRVVIDDTGYEVEKDFPFCHCGAKMEVEQYGKN